LKTGQTARRTGTRSFGYQSLLLHPSVLLKTDLIPSLISDRTVGAFFVGNVINQPDDIFLKPQRHKQSWLTVWSSDVLAHHRLIHNGFIPGCGLGDPAVVAKTENAFPRRSQISTPSPNSSCERVRMASKMIFVQQFFLTFSHAINFTSHWNVLTESKP
jgi:hypothetical protein